MKKQRGGARPNAGRHKVKDPVVTFAIYPRKSWLETLGKEDVKKISVQAIEKEVKQRCNNN